MLKQVFRFDSEMQFDIQKKIMNTLTKCVKYYYYKVYTLILMLVAGFFLTITDSVYAQENESDLLFENAVLPVIELEMNPDSLAWLLQDENLGNYRYLHASFHYLSADIDSVIEDVGVRLRGNTSRLSAKKSFKISFDAFDDETRFYGMKKFNLNGEHNDPSISRSKLGWDLFNFLDVPASRATHVRLYINDEYRGLYLHVEEYDKTFLRSRFTINEGNFYKCLWPAPLQYIGNDPDLYKYEQENRRAYALKTNEEEDDYSGLAHFIDILNNTGGADFQDSLENNLNVLGFIQAQAAEVLLGHWDDYWYNQNNYWLYQNPENNKFEFIPYDIDNTFGIRWDNNDWGTRHVRFWGQTDGSRPLANRILNVDQYRNIYSLAIRNTVNQYFNSGDMTVRVNDLHAYIEDAAEEDLYRTYDYGWTFEDFQSCFNQPLGAHVAYGINPYITARSTSALNQSTASNIQPFFASKPEVSFLPETQELQILIKILNENENMQVTLYLEDTENFVEYAFEYQQTENYGVLPLAVFTANIPHNSPDGDYNYYIEAQDYEGSMETSPRNTPGILHRYHFNGIFINEFLASNDSYGMDENGEYDDWVEIYNASTEDISLLGYYLSDNPGNPFKWAFPDVTVNSGQYLIVWTDDDEEQGQLHTSFKLSADGEYVGLYKTNNTLPEVADSVYFGPQTTDISMGRYPDGNANWYRMTPTFGTANSEPMGVEENTRLPEQQVLVWNYPNPFNSTTEIKFSLPVKSEISLTVYDILGREVVNLTNGEYTPGEYSFSWNARQSLASGLYFVQLKTDYSASTCKLLLIK